MTRYWLTYDLDNPNTYDYLYKWIAKTVPDTVECGGTTVSFIYSGNLETLKKDLLDNVANITREKIYIVYKKETGGYAGQFLWGKRNIKTPWDIYLVQENSEVDS